MKLNLIKYIKEGNFKEIKNLIDFRPESVYERDEYANTPLHYAIIMCDLNTVNLLLSQAKHLVNTVNELGNSPLMVAAGNNNIEIVERLLTYKASTDLENFNGFTSAHFAAFSNNFSIMNLLAKHGGNILAPGVLHGAIAQAIEDQNWKLTKWLITQGADLVCYKNNGLSAYDLIASNEIGIEILNKSITYNGEVIIGEQPAEDY